MQSEQRFDVFMCHNSEDKSAVIALAERLEEEGLRLWLDEWELQPGLDWSDELDKQIGEIATAAVFVGSSGIGPWQDQEIKAFLTEFVERGCPVIPVILEGAQQRPDIPRFLRGKIWVDFRRQRPEPFERLLWGITGENPRKRKSSNGGQASDYDFTIRVADEPPMTSRTTNQVEGFEECCLDVRYSVLEWYLRNKRWKEADVETYRLMITEVDKREGQWFSVNDLLNFPCEPLKRIDTLWTKHSGGKFGFSAQRDIYLEFGDVSNSESSRDAFFKMTLKNEWHGGDALYDLDYPSVPRGHLPRLLFFVNNWVPAEIVTFLNGGGFLYLVSRIRACEL